MPANARKQEKAGKPGIGRPSAYNETLGNEINDRIAKGETLTAVCAEPHMPDRITVWRWLADEALVSFATGYMRARVNQTHSLVEEALAVARSKSLTSRNAYPAKVRIDTLLTVAARINPSQYSERFNAALAGADRVTVNNVISLTPPNTGDDSRRNTIENQSDRPMDSQGIVIEGTAKAD